MVTYVFLQIETVKAVNLSLKDVAFRETPKTVKLAGSAQLGEGRRSKDYTFETFIGGVSVLAVFGVFPLLLVMKLCPSLNMRKILSPTSQYCH